MGMRVIIENTGDKDADKGSESSARVEFYDPGDMCTAERLGQLIGYALNGIESFVVPGDVFAGIDEVITSDMYSKKRGSR